MFYMKYSYIRLRQIYLALAVKNIQASLIFLARFLLYSPAADILGTRCEKYSSKLDISRSFLVIFACGRYTWHSL